MKIKDLIEHLNNYDLNAPCAYSLWLTDDVQMIAKDRFSTKLSGCQVENVLDTINSNFDANDGISWDHLEYTIKNVLEED